MQLAVLFFELDQNAMIDIGKLIKEPREIQANRIRRGRKYHFTRILSSKTMFKLDVFHFNHLYIIIIGDQLKICKGDFHFVEKRKFSWNPHKNCES